jgi:glycosyltransferase involved in cell wall biosynthesis
VDWTFYCTLTAPGELDEEVRSLGGRVVHSPVPIGRQLSFARALRRELRTGGYEILHCHHDLVSSVYLAASAGLPLRRRLVHVHNADEAVLTPSRLKRSLYREPMRRVCLLLADRIVGISNHTLDKFLAGRRRRALRDVVHYYGVDPIPFQSETGRERMRRELGIPQDAPILLFAGRLAPEKNPLFTVDVLAELRTRDPRAFGVICGAGSLEAAVCARAAERGVANAIRLVGWRKDVAALMSASDWFILPRSEEPMEGFGLAVVEAQLAGLRLLLSRGISDDPLLATACYRRLSLASGAAAWADAAQEMNSATPSRAAALEALAASPMAMDAALEGLLALYE